MARTNMDSKKRGSGAAGSVQKKAYGTKKPNTYVPKERTEGEKKKYNAAKHGSSHTENTESEPKNKKELKKERQLARPHGEMMFTARKLWEVVRDSSNKDKDLRKKNVGEMVKLLEGQMLDVIFRHDATRIIQSMVQFGSVEQRAVVFGELKGSFVELMTNTYSKFLVNKMLDYGTPEQREEIIKSMYGNVRKLVKHPDGSDVLEHAFLERSNATQRNALIQEFYSPEFAVFKNPDIKSLAELIALKPEKKEVVIKSMLDLILSCVNKAVVTPNIIHRAIKEYMEVVDSEKKQELATALAEHVVAMLHTRDGSIVGMETIWNNSAKDRKTIVKGFKKHVVQVCMEEYGHLVLLALFDSMDDTVLVKKSIINEIVDELLTVCQDKSGRLVVLYLLNPRNKRYLMPALQTRLELGDSNVFSKKDRAQRANELRLALLNPLLAQIATDPVEYLATGKLCQVVEEALKVAEVSNPLRAKAVEGILKAVTEDQTLFSDPQSGILFKRLMLDQVMISEEKSFAHATWETVHDNIAEHAKTTQGCYNFVALLTTKSLPLTDRKVFGTEIRNTLVAIDALPSPTETTENGKFTAQAVLAKALATVADATEDSENDASTANEVVNNNVSASRQKKRKNDGELSKSTPKKR
eukprot:CFRG2389T1